MIVGRCADFVLKGRKDVVKLFIYSDTETAIKNVYDRYGLDGKDAMRLIEKKTRNAASITATIQAVTGRTQEIITSALIQAV